LTLIVPPDGDTLRFIQYIPYGFEGCRYKLEFQLPLHFIRGAQIFQKFGSHHTILGARWVHEAGSITDPRIVRVIGQNLVGRPTWLRYFCTPAYYLRYLHCEPAAVVSCIHFCSCQAFSIINVVIRFGKYLTMYSAKRRIRYIKVAEYYYHRMCAKETHHTPLNTKWK